MNAKNTESPKHVAIIMDGNGRWANSRGHTRVWGHIRGARVVSDIVDSCLKYGIENLTLFTFSTENWSRPMMEIKVLYALLKKFLQRERSKLHRQKVCFRLIGDISTLPKPTQDLINEISEETSEYTNMTLTLAFGYGGRSDILQAVNTHISENPGQIISETDLSKCLLTSPHNDVDLLIRTGGDRRISNFLLWQVAYAELFFTDTRWPDFTQVEFEHIVTTFGQVERRFGSVASADYVSSQSLAAKTLDNLRNHHH
jgi:undecaprenyl diphosphate synthase